MPHPARPTVTLHDVAAAAGVSLATASRVLGGSSRTVAPEFERRVLAAAAALRYTADVSARAMRAGNDTVALVADDLTTPSIGMVVAAMERQARTVDAFVSVSSTRGSPERQLETVRMVCAFRPRALVLTSSRIEAAVLDGRLLAELLDYERRGGRVVIFGDTDMPFNSIGVDNRASARRMGLHLAGTGHRQVVILAGTRDKANVSARATGYMEGLLAGGVDVQDVRVVNCDVSRRGGFEAVNRLVDDGLGEIDAIAAANDVIAIGALAACRAAGIDVPGRLSVTGFDDIRLAADVTPRLTTMALPLADIGAESVRRALAIGDENGPGLPDGAVTVTVTSRAGSGRITRQTVEGTLVVRDSTMVRTG